MVMSIGLNHKHRLAILGLMILALAIRLWHVGFGLPVLYHPDEPVKAMVIDRLLNGQPLDYFLHPCLLINAGALASWVGIQCGLVADTANIILCGRIMMVLVGVVTLLPVYVIGRDLFGRRAGLFAAALIAVCPIHAIHSRYLKEDVLLTFWAACTLMALVGWLRRGSGGKARLLLCMAFIFAGLTVASKLIGVVSLLLVFVMAVIYARPRILALAGLLLSAAAFLVASPQAIADVDVARRDLVYEIGHGVDSNRAQRLRIHEWPDYGTFFIWNGLGKGMGWIGAAAGIAGLLAALRFSRSRPELFWVAATGLAYYAVHEIGTLKRIADADRYILVCVPALAVMAAGVFTDGSKTLFGRWGLSSRLRWALGAAALLLPFAHSLAITYAMGHDTRVIAADWLAANGPRPPYTAVSLDEKENTIEQSRVPGVNFLRVSSKFNEGEVKIADQGRVLILSSIRTERYDRFPRQSKRNLAMLNQLRAKFPEAVIFSRPLTRYGYHNPTIELRFREPLPGTPAP